MRGARGAGNEDCGSDNSGVKYQTPWIRGNDIIGVGEHLERGSWSVTILGSLVTKATPIHFMYSQQSPSFDQN